MKYINLKLHSEYSLLEGVGSLKEYVERAKDFGQEVLGLTDTSLFALVKFYDICIKNNIKPILGYEVYIRGFNSEDLFALTIFAKNNEGLKEISNLSTISYEKQEKEGLLVDIEDIQSLKNVYILSGGIKSELTKYIKSGDYYRANIVVKELKNKFNNIYLEAVSIKSTFENREMYEKLCEENELEPILTSDVYYLNREDHELQKIFAAIKENRTLSTVKNYLEDQDLYFKESNYLENIYSKDFYNKAMSNMECLINNCNVKITKGKVDFPVVLENEEKKDREYIEELIREKLPNKYSNITDEISKRIKYELDIIDNMGYIRYFLIVMDFISYAKENNIYIGPGRGSAAGSIISYILGITEVDPIKYGLFFERFLNPERISMPDIDVDIEQERRGEVIEYLKRKYGARNVSQIITFSTFKPALALKDISKVLEIPEKSIRNIIDKSKIYGLDGLDDKRDIVKKLIDYAKRIENKPKNMSTHAAGVIISKNDMRDELPLVFNGKDYQVQYEAQFLEELGYLKMDLLGLKNLNTIKSSVEKSGLKDNIYKLKDEKEAYDLLNLGDTLGIFQCESDGITRLAKKLKINSLEDIALLLALYRPGPLESGYINNLIEVKNNNNIKVKYIHPLLEKILAPTYGVLVYQEQVMQIAREISGYSLASADELRKAIGKKNPEILKEHRKKFIENAIVPKEIAEEIYDLIEKFGNYGFNKAHAISYAVITYQTLYLKAKYPKEFYSSYLSSELKSETKLLRASEELNRKGIELKKPDINKSIDSFSVEDKGVRMPLSSIKEMSEKSAREIMEIRKSGEFKDFKDFYIRCNFLNKSNIEGLIYAGCFDTFGVKRKTLINNLPEFLKWATKKIKVDNDIHTKLFLNHKTDIEDFVFNDTEEFSFKDIVNFEVEYIKISLRIKKFLQENIFYKILKLPENLNIGYIESIKNRVTKRNELMANVIITDTSGRKEYIVFPREMNKFGNLFKQDDICIFSYNKLDDGKFAINRINNIKNINNGILSLRINSDFDSRDELIDLIKSNKGSNAIKIYKVLDGKKEVNNMSDKYNIEINEKVITKLINLLGESNVKVIVNQIL